MRGDREIEVDIVAGRSSGGDRPYFVQIADRTSGIKIAEVHMTADQFAAMLTGLYTTATASVPSSDGLALVGQGRVVEIHVVPITRDSWHMRHAIAQQFADQHGIAYDRTDLPTTEGSPNSGYNIHRRDGDGYQVRFTRWEDPEKIPKKEIA